MLHPVSDTSAQLLRLAANRDEPKAQLPSKRKRDSLCGLGTFTEPFTIRPHVGSFYTSPATFRPVRVIARSQLSLKFLDTSPDDDFAPHSLFTAQIHVLEEADLRSQGGRAPKILIARCETKRTLYAIERVQLCVYSICRLASWLREKDVAELWDPANIRSLPANPKPDAETTTQGGWWRHAVVETQAVESLTKRARMTMLRPKSVPKMITNQSHQPGEALRDQYAAGLDTVPTEFPLEPLVGLASPHEQLASLVHQYLDAVYMSKTSLAYFAKGPITRTRNAFTSTEEGAPTTHELVAFLRTMLLSPKASEKKYHDKLPSLIKAIPPGSYSDDEVVTGAGKTNKSKKKMKLSRNGVYPQEEAFIKKWWQSELPNGDSMATETMEQRIKRRIGDLRVRETLAQLILMLEINDGADANGRSDSNDRLHSFCVEVIIPFYINRLPEQALIVNKKLGGPTHSQSSKRKAMKPPLTSRNSGDSKEPEIKKPRRSLARVATDNTGRTIERTTPSLNRSATDSALPEHVKREGSEVSLSSIPFRRSPSKSNRQSMSQIRHLQGRQIDLAQPSAAASAKIKQRQRVEEDLQEAILALKKPNRGLAAGGYAVDNEQRGLGLANKSRKPTTTVRKTIKDVQVSATPRAGRRTKDIVEQTPSRHQHNPFIRLPAGEAPGSSDLCIPSSTVRPPAFMVPATGHRRPTARDVAQSTIAETPSKVPDSRVFSSEPVRRKIFATPSKAAAPSPDGRLPPPPQVLETPAKNFGSSPPGNSNSPPRRVVATPSKSGSGLPKGFAPVPFSLPDTHEAETSIYDALGWNDDDDAFA
ncbi:SLD3 multi-domain protein [Pyrenophora tritici-repentis]|nr:SLD3 multi-domain protein [Pyrenophora tritici-repentis]KAF7453880.1 SLD3 multi-domain protein [Pyrenophora tritici-repentis]KAI0586693.1 SLD3 multi-domain protein [Pyrenophora tritici-repentis]KAI0592504.1 SLD3 multi-domain protein [Pyrenophora tritici-repentis]KAI0608729.1 SLD3 multi-domain protein [Pyrenophora tritici-repentis]